MTTCKCQVGITWNFSYFFLEFCCFFVGVPAPFILMFISTQIVPQTHKPSFLMGILPSTRTACINICSDSVISRCGIHDGKLRSSLIHFILPFTLLCTFLDNWIFWVWYVSLTSIFSPPVDWDFLHTKYNMLVLRIDVQVSVLIRGSRAMRVVILREGLRWKR